MIILVAFHLTFWPCVDIECKNQNFMHLCRNGQIIEPRKVVPSIYLLTLIISGLHFSGSQHRYRVEFQPNITLGLIYLLSVKIRLYLIRHK